MARGSSLTSSRFLPIALLGLADAYIVYSIVCMDYIQSVAVSSDQLTIISLADDILRNPGFSSFAWNFSRAPYFFPDLMLSLGISSLVQSDVRTVIIMLFAQATFIASMGFFLCSRLGRTRERAIGIAAIYGSIGILCCIGIRHGWYPDAVIWPYFSYSHAGALDLTLLGFVALAAGRYASPRHPFWLTISTLVTTLAYVSDKTSIVLFLPPALTYTFLKPRGPRALALVSFGAVQAIALATMWIVDHTFYFQIMESNAIADIPRHLLYMSHIFSAQPLSSKAFIVLASVSIVVVTIRSLVRIGRSGRDDSFDRDGLAFLLAASSVLDAMLCVWLWSVEEAGLARYAVMFEFAGPVLLAYGLASLTVFRVRSPATVGLSAVASMLVAGVIAWQGPGDPFAAFAAQQARAREIKTCAKDNDLHSGLAAYWIARQLSSSTNWQIQVDQFEPGQPNPFFWGSDLLWYFDKLDGGRPVRHDFVVLNDLPSGGVFAKFGTPDRVVECGRYRLALYGASGRLDGQLRRDLASMPLAPSVRDHLPRPIVVELSASRSDFGIDDLRSLVGRREPGSITLTAGDKPGYALYGPYVSLDAGRYSVDVTFTCGGRLDGSLFEVVAGDQHSRLTDWPIGDHSDACDGRQQHARFGFSADAPLSMVEVRAFYGGRGDLTISGVHLAPEPGA